MPILSLINATQLLVAYSTQRDEVMIVRYVQPLTEEQRERLDKTMKEDASFRARTRAHGLVLSAQGMTIRDRQDLSGPSRHRVGLDPEMGTSWRPEFA